MRRALFLLFSLMFWCLSTFSPNAGIQADSWGSLLSAQAWLEHGGPELSPYAARVDLYAYQFFHNPQGAFYAYPPFPVLLEVPFVAVGRLFGLQMWDGPAESMVQRQMVAFSLIALMALLDWGYRSLFSSPVISLCWAFFSIAAGACLGSLGAAFNSQVPAVVFITWSQVLFLRERYGKGSWSGWQVGALLALGYFSRPTGAVWIPPALLYVLWRKPRQFVPALLTLVGLLGLYTLGCEHFFGTPVHRYFQSRTLFLDPLLFSQAAVGVMFSPVVGVFVYQPLLILSFLLGPALLRRNALFWSLYLFVGMHWTVVALQFDWWGATYGSRLTAETVLPLSLIGAMLWQRSPLPKVCWPLFGLGLGWSLWVNLWVSYTRVEAHMVFNDLVFFQDPERRVLWDWSRAPFWVTAAQLQQVRDANPTAMFPKLNQSNRQGFGDFGRAGDHLYVTPREDNADISFLSEPGEGRQSGSILFRYSSLQPVPVLLNGQNWTTLPATRRVVERAVFFENVEWGAANRLGFSASPELRIFDLEVQNWDAGRPGGVTYLSGWGSNEAPPAQPTFRWAYGPECQLRLSAPRGGRVRLTWKGAAPKDGGRLGVWVSGQERARISSLPTQATPMQVDLDIRSGITNVDFRFSQWGSSWGGDQRPLALSFEGLKLSWAAK